MHSRGVRFRPGFARQTQQPSPGATSAELSSSGRTWSLSTASGTIGSSTSTSTLVPITSTTTTTTTSGSHSSSSAVPSGSTFIGGHHAVPPSGNSSSVPGSVPLSSSSRLFSAPTRARPPTVSIPDGGPITSAIPSPAATITTIFSSGDIRTPLNGGSNTEDNNGNTSVAVPGVPSPIITSSPTGIVVDSGPQSSVNSTTKDTDKHGAGSSTDVNRKSSIGVILSVTGGNLRNSPSTTRSSTSTTTGSTFLKGAVPSSGSDGPDSSGGAGDGDGGAGFGGFGNGGNGGVGDGNNGGSDRNSKSKRPLTGGDIAAIIVVILVGIIIFFIRRRAKAQKHRRSRNWRLSGRRTSEGDDDRLTQSLPQPSRGSYGSFSATHRTGPPLHCEITPLPPMADINRTSPLNSPSALDPNSATFQPDERRLSSSSSWLSEDSAYSSSGLESAIMDRSLSPTPESKPFLLVPYHQGILAAQTTTQMKEVMPVNIPSAYFRKTTAILPPLPPLPKSPPPVPSSNPFADNNPFDDPPLSKAFA